MLIVMGGALNLAKCYWYMIVYSCREEEWDYSNVNNYDLSVPMTDGSHKIITQLHFAEAKKVLGVWSNPMGSDNTHLQEVVIGKITK